MRLETMQFGTSLLKGLTPLQHQYLDAARWLQSEHNRRQGRTHLLAVVAIEWALLNPGVWTRFADHYDAGVAGQRRAFDYLRDLVTGKVDGFEFHMADRRFRYVEER